MPIERTSSNDQTVHDATGPRARTGRLAAIFLIGLGSASCVSIEALTAVAPEYGALAGLAGSALAVAGLMLLLNGQIRERRAKAEEKRRVQRIAPYQPVMAHGASGASALSAVLAPAGEAASEPVRLLSVVSPQAVARAPRRKTTCTGASVTLFQHGPESDPELRGGRTQKALYAAMRLGGEWAEDLDLSPRAMARLEADPFVQRLARIG